jgi:hypothetical protein
LHQADSTIEKEDAMRRRHGRTLALVQGVYFAASGVWPLVHMRSFERVTGPKVDKWLVRTVGVLVVVIGGVLSASAIRRRLPGETVALAAGTAAGLAAIDTIYAGKGRISRVYLADAVVEAALVGLWLKWGRIVYS